jgi:hypothetical protein
VDSIGLVSCIDSFGLCGFRVKERGRTLRASATGRSVVRPAASALASLQAARTGTGWLGYTASAGLRLLS